MFVIKIAWVAQLVYLGLSFSVNIQAMVSGTKPFLLSDLRQRTPVSTPTNPKSQDPSKKPTTGTPQAPIELLINKFLPEEEIIEKNNIFEKLVSKPPLSSDDLHALIPIGIIFENKTPFEITRIIKGTSKGLISKCAPANISSAPKQTMREKSVRNAIFDAPFFSPDKATAFLAFKFFDKCDGSPGGWRSLGNFIIGITLDQEDKLKARALVSFLPPTALEFKPITIEENDKSDEVGQEYFNQVHHEAVLGPVVALNSAQGVVLVAKLVDLEVEPVDWRRPFAKLLRLGVEKEPCKLLHVVFAIK